MGDAEIIPIGTRGRPGRGNGGERPSAGSRGLAARTPRPRDTDPVEAPSPADSVASAVDGPPAADAPVAPAQRTPGPTEPTGTTGPTASDRAPARTEHRLPGPAIAPREWLAALTRTAQEMFGESWEPRLAQFLAVLRRRLTGEFVVDDFGFDAEFTDRFLLSALRPVAQKWFRIEVIGADNIPDVGGALVVSNHSGTVPVDGMMTAVTVFDHTGRHLRPLGADLVFKLPLVGDLARRGGATLACNEDAERMLREGELVGVWPEGFKGIGKPFSERYKLQRFGRGGFVSAAIRTGVPIVPTSVVGAEEIYPLVGNVPSLARLLGVPYLPITPLFPLLGPLGLIPLPSKWLIEFGEPIRTDEYDAGAADDPMLVFNVTDQVRESIQQTLYTLLMKRRSVFS
ncbi:lysophospholipid acyltransferase family protein [Nocardioides aurantiacus]|uniref:1-acyl-sn-glycerol-3-phosphate acyltransferase n=1 Tax=Nocardioides aurantiacus TaxID=86796 RepID=A0A3N2CPP3_9ACTN|nr:lysophospholipid acyltransferase family protein [Nocardioides aurantiacus]ROR89483.1 1-acyl-sn-glycerol-3-phosphate acyltransferase [Nocardioides aurantiacus]